MPVVSAVSLPDHLRPGGLAGRVAVVIDVLRATTTIARAFDEGAGCVIPVSSVAGARLVAHDLPGALLCGERGGVRPEGFALGNSPSEYTRERVAGRSLVLTTTNGTRALQMCDGASDVYTASLTNLEAVGDLLGGLGADIVLVCSGTDGRVSLEDCIGAGLLADRLRGTHALDDSASLMAYGAAGAIERCGGLEGAIRSSFHARRLEGLGFGGDVRYASRVGASVSVPQFDPVTGEIRPAVQPGGARA